MTRRNLFGLSLAPMFVPLLALRGPDMAKVERYVAAERLVDKWIGVPFCGNSLMLAFDERNAAVAQLTPQEYGIGLRIFLDEWARSQPDA